MSILWWYSDRPPLYNREIHNETPGFKYLLIGLGRSLPQVCRQLFQVRKTDFFRFWVMSPWFLTYTRAWSRKKSRLTTPKNRTSKNQGDVEAFKMGYWGGKPQINVDLEKILSLTYLGGIFLKFHIKFLMYNIIALLTLARICEAISSLEEKASSRT